MAALIVAGTGACFGGRAAAADAPRHPGPAQASTAPAAPAAPAPRGETKVTVDNPSDYLDEKIIAIFKDHHATNGHFKFSVVPMTPELWIAGEYPKWAEKRYSKERMEELVAAQMPIFEDSMLAVLTIVFMGDMFSKGRVQFEVPDDICEYIFLENERGEAIRCTRANIPIMRMPGPFTKQVNVELEFANLRSADAEFFQTKTVKFVVGGLEFPHNEITYPYPLSDLFGDAPDPLREMYRSSGIWSG